MGILAASVTQQMGLYGQTLITHPRGFVPQLPPLVNNETKIKNNKESGNKDAF
jgi:hypothetical protein